MTSEYGRKAQPKCLRTDDVRFFRERGRHAWGEAGRMETATKVTFTLGLAWPRSRARRDSASGQAVHQQATASSTRHGHTAASRARCCSRPMTNLLSVLPDFDIKPYTHILPSLEKTLISTSDLLTLDAIDVAKRAQVPASEVRKLCDALLDGLKVSPIQGDNASDDASETRGASPFTRGNELKRQWTISTLDAAVDETLSGGIHSGYLTEITGER